jgi:hypothetical protein
MNLSRTSDNDSSPSYEDSIVGCYRKMRNARLTRGLESNSSRPALQKHPICMHCCPRRLLVLLHLLRTTGMAVMLEGRTDSTIALLPSGCIPYPKSNDGMARGTNLFDSLIQRLKYRITRFLSEFTT